MSERILGNYILSHPNTKEAKGKTTRYLDPRAFEAVSTYRSLRVDANDGVCVVSCCPGSQQLMKGSVGGIIASHGYTNQIYHMNFSIPQKRMAVKIGRRRIGEGEVIRG